MFQLAQGYSAASASAALDTNDTLLATYLAPRCFCLLLAAAGPQVGLFHIFSTVTGQRCTANLPLRMPLVSTADIMLDSNAAVLSVFCSLAR